MQRKTWINAMVGVSLAVGGIVSITGEGTAVAHTSGQKRSECNNRLLKGTYGIQLQGTRPAPGGAGMETVIGIVTRTFDGAGSFTQLDNVKGSLSGFAPDRPGVGTYEVNDDCTGTTRFVPGPGVVVEERFVLLDYGHEIRSITTSPQPIMVTTVGKRVGFR